MELPAHDKDDYMVWTNDKSGTFSSKSAYAFLQHEAASSSSLFTVTQLRIFKILWHLPVILKWKFFLWKLLYDRIFTKERYPT